VVDSRSSTQEDKLALCGIKQILSLSVLPSVHFSTSFPYDFMYLIWENLIPNLFKLWTCNFKDCDQDSGDYQLAKTVIEGTGVAVATSAKTILSSFGAHVLTALSQFHALGA
jgi:hypothetical protein